MLLTLSRIALYASLFSIVIVMPSTFFPFIGGKYYFFRACVELSLAFLLLWWAFEAKKGEFEQRFKKILGSPLFLAVAVFSLVFILASLFAYNPHGAFWSNYERGEGGFQMLHYFLFFTLLTFLCQDAASWRRVFYVSLAAALVMIGYGVLAAARIQGFIGPYMATDETRFLARLFSHARFQGSLGNPAYVAPYLLFSMFYALWLFASDKVRTFNKGLLFGGLALVYLVFFVLSETRGGFIGLVAAAVAFFAWLVFSYVRTSRTLLKRATAAFLACGIALGILWYFRDTPTVQAIPGSRFLTISVTEQSFQTRFWTWNSAWEGFKERPILGWGPENFSAVFDRHFDIRHYTPGKSSETWFDRAHSVIFDYLTETGILGLLAYIAMFVVFYLQFFRATSRKLLTDEKTGFHIGPVSLGLFGTVLIGYLVQGLVLFDVLPIYMNLFLVLAFAVYLFNHAFPSHESKS